PPAALPVPKQQASAPGVQIPANRTLPITLDTVLRLAEHGNAKIEQSRVKVDASMSAASASCSWLPTVYAGTAYYRHEGGIQNFDGTFIHSSTGALFPGLQINSEFDIREQTFKRVDAERKMWQDRAEGSQVTSETLLDAANTYFDLLTARR